MNCGLKPGLMQDYLPEYRDKQPDISGNQTKTRQEGKMRRITKKKQRGEEKRARENREWVGPF